MALTQDQQARLNAIANRRTRYEVAAIAADGSKAVVLGFSGRKTKRGLLAFATERGPELLGKFGAPDPSHKWTYINGVLDFGTFVVVYRRTERDAILCGPESRDVSL